jgi:anti-sigma factor ChrR (cupin superfamily)
LRDSAFAHLQSYNQPRLLARRRISVKLTKEDFMTERIVNSPELVSHFVNSAEMAWQATDFDKISMKVLYRDDQGRSTIMFKMEPGAIVPLHEHTALEQTFVLEGSLEDDEGVCSAGNFVWRPGGNTHIAHAPNGAVIISIFNKPNRFMDGAKFFTESE